MRSFTNYISCMCKRKNKINNQVKIDKKNTFKQENSSKIHVWWKRSQSECSGLTARSSVPLAELHDVLSHLGTVLCFLCLVFLKMLKQFRCDFPLAPVTLSLFFFNPHSIFNDNYLCLCWHSSQIDLLKPRSSEP